MQSYYTKLFLSIMTASLMLLAGADAVIAGPLEDAKAAEKRGDYATAFEIVQPLANQGNARAQHELGFMYWSGQGVRKDYAEAIKWYRRAAEQGYANAQWSLGHMYRTGTGLPQSYAEAFKWFRLSAEQGYAGSQDALGDMYSNGQGVLKNEAQGVLWYFRAANQGFPHAQLMLGLTYSIGDAGLPQDWVHSYMWLSLAAANASLIADGSRGGLEWAKIAKDAISARNSTATFMTREQLAEAQKLVREWKPQLPATALTDDDVAPPKQKSTQTSRAKVQLKANGDILVVPVEINGAMTLDFMIDSGASDVSIPADVFSTLSRTGTIKESDLVGQRTYVLADGSKAESPFFTIKSLRIQNIILNDVTGSVGPSQGPLLLGQRFYSGLNPGPSTTRNGN
jgi:TPR repeat protein